MQLFNTTTVGVLSDALTNADPVPCKPGAARTARPHTTQAAKEQDTQIQEPSEEASTHSAAKDEPSEHRSKESGASKEQEARRPLRPLRPPRPPRTSPSLPAPDQASDAERAALVLAANSMPLQSRDGKNDAHTPTTEPVAASGAQQAAQDPIPATNADTKPSSVAALPQPPVGRAVRVKAAASQQTQRKGEQPAKAAAAKPATRRSRAKE
jgi:hypothetical protein